MTREQIENSFTYHKPVGLQVDLYQALRSKGLELAELIFDLCPSSPDTTLAIRHVEDAIMRANKSIACSGVDYE